MGNRGKAQIIGGLCALACTVLLICGVVLPMQPSAPVENNQISQAVTNTLAQQSLADESAEELPENAVEIAGAVEGSAVEAGVYDGETVLVSIPAGISPDQAVASIAEETGIDGLALSDGSSMASSGEDGGSTLVELALPAGVGVEDAVARIGATSAVDSVQPNYLYYIQDDGAQPQSNMGGAGELTLTTQGTLASDLVAQALSINDPGAGEQWGLKSINAYQGKEGTAWEKQKVSNSVTVAIIDEGFDANHLDLKPNVKLTYNATNGSSNVAESAGHNGHGTHVAGIVSACANNDVGVAGVSYNANLALIKVVDSQGAIDSNSIVTAIDYIIRNKNAYNIRVVNMSLGGKWNTYADPSGPDKAVMRAIDRATANGIVVVCSAGNADAGYGWQVPFVDFPADYGSVVSVINLQQSGSTVVRYVGSNYNQVGSTTLAMPDGKNISAPGTEIYSTMPGSTYGYKGGTSMAAPHVSAALALAFAQRPSLSAPDAVSLLYSAATDIASPGWDRETGHGEVNAYTMVNGGGYLSGASSVQAGKAIQLTPSSGASGSWTWSTSNASIATVSGGKVTGVSGGMAHITATGKIDGKQMTLRKDILVYKASISGAASVQAGKAVQLSVNSAPVGDWVWSTSDASVATVNGNGVVTGKTPNRTVSITARLSNNANVAVSKTLRVTASISGAKVSAVAQLYTGKALTPMPTVKIGNTTLKYGTDFSVSYKNNVHVGTATVVVTGKGNYTGTAMGTFRIVLKPSWSGASQVPAGATATYAVSNGSIAIKSLSSKGVASLSGKTLTGAKAGTVVLSLRDAAGVERATKKVSIYALSGTWELRSALTSNRAFALDISGASTRTGANVQIYRSNKTPAQRFRFTMNGDGTFRIANIKSGKVIDVSGGSHSNGANIWQWPWNGTNAQRWRMTVDAANRVTLLNKGSGRALDVYAGRAANSTNVWQYTSNGTNAQKWILVKV